MSNRQRKIMLIGATGYNQSDDEIKIDCFEWREIQKIENIKDYDVLILDLLKLDTEEVRKKIKWKHFISILNFEITRDVMLNNGMIIVIGDPRFTIIDKIVNFLDWSGLIFYWDNRPGTTIITSNDYRHKKLLEYLKYLKDWKYSLSVVEINKQIIEPFFNIEYLKKRNAEISIKKDNLCETRYNCGVAFEIRYQILGTIYIYRNKEKNVVHSYGPMIFLPKINLDEDETLLLVLKDICGIEMELPEPEWLEKYPAPGQAKIDTKIKEIETISKKLLNQLEEEKLKRKNVRRCLKLLYDTKHSLEPIVREILQVLGAQLEEPKENNKEDGWVKVNIEGKTYEGVLEIKSTKSAQFGEEGIKQLLNWINRGKILRKKKYKGIFIGNNAINISPDKRTNAFSDGWVKSAELSEICALKSEELYFIYLINSKNNINLNLFWEELFNTNGIFNMKSFLNKIGYKENI
jgi:6-pyruvoyl-tetrahydropterin synthase